MSTEAPYILEIAVSQVPGLPAPIMITWSSSFAIFYVFLGEIYLNVYLCSVAPSLGLA
jgi:hypothetical protein